MKILIFHAGALGDLVNTAPALSALRSRFPDANITIAGNLEFLPLFYEAGFVDRILSLDSHGFHELWSDEPASQEVKELIAGFDLAVSWVRSPKLVERLNRLGLRVAAFSCPFPPSPGSGHVSEVMAGPLWELEINEAIAPPKIVLPQSLISERLRFPGIIIHPGSGSRHKNWPAQNFIRAGEILHQKTGLEIALLSGPADEEVANEVAEGLGPVVKSRFSGLSIISLAALLSSAKLMVGNDSGVSHLAGAVGAPVVAIYGPTDPGGWRVRQESAINLSAGGIACSPCSREVMAVCERKICLEQISPEIMTNTCFELLARG